MLLACDVLYEDTSVDLVAEAVPRLLFSAGGRLVLADPTYRTEQNRCSLESSGRGPNCIEGFTTLRVFMSAEGRLTCKQDCPLNGWTGLHMRVCDGAQSWAATLLSSYARTVCCTDEVEG